jgi:tetratricopeptide (TPR) repeat protein
MKRNFALFVVLVIVPALAATNCSRGGDEANTATSAAPSPTAAPDGTSEQQTVTLSLPEGSDARAYFEHGLEAYRQNRDEVAVAAFRKAAEMDPEMAEAHYRLGLALSALGRDEEADESFQIAVEAYEKLLKEDPKNSEAQYLLGLTYGKLGKYEEAVKALKDSVKNSPEEDDDKYYELGLAHYKLAQYKESMTALNKALEINPDYFPATDALERARSGFERREAFLKRQEQLRKQQEQRGRPGANANSNSNGGVTTQPSAPTAAPAPTPGR